VRLHHVGIAVDDLEAALERYTGLLGGSLMRRGDFDGLLFALVDSGGMELELLHAKDAGDAIGKFVAERGPGIHHLAFEVDDIDAEVARLTQQGLEQSGDIRIGIHGTEIVFFHPKTTGGVLTELVQAHA
jgi:methylmalonyl-CoA/ethylmalonyl-CoA epimerase